MTEAPLSTLHPFVTQRLTNLLAEILALENFLHHGEIEPYAKTDKSIEVFLKALEIRNHGERLHS
jgi:hypothetical protein